MKKPLFYIFMVLLIFISIELVIRIPMRIMKHKEKFLERQRALLMQQKTKEEKDFLQLISSENARSQEFQTVWEHDVLVVMSKKQYVPDTRIGYKPKPNTTVYTIKGNPHFGTSIQFVPDEKILAILPKIPGEISISHFNELGLRSTLPLVDNAKDKILLLGDSFTEGLFINDEDTFCSVLEQLFLQQADDIQILNGGVNGYGTKEEFFLLEDILKEAGSLKGVVINFFPNDPYRDYSKVVGYCTPIETQGIGRFFYRSSVIFRTLVKFYATEVSRPVYPDIEKGWQDSFSYLEKIQKLCKDRGIFLAISLIPPKEQFRYGKRKYYQERVINFCKEKQISVFDPYFYFKELKEKNIYIDNDAHFSKSGHRIYAAFLFESLKNTQYFKQPEI